MDAFIGCMWEPVRGACGHFRPFCVDVISEPPKGREHLPRDAGSTFAGMWSLDRDMCFPELVGRGPTYNSVCNLLPFIGKLSRIKE